MTEQYQPSAEMRADTIRRDPHIEPQALMTPRPVANRGSGNGLGGALLVVLVFIVVGILFRTISDNRYFGQNVENSQEQSDPGTANP